MVTPDWNKELEIMCDASDYAMVAVLGQRTKKMFKAVSPRTPLVEILMITNQGY